MYKSLVPGPTAEGMEISLPRRYYAKMRPVAEQQLAKAGIRLAAVLNGIYGEGK